jgi:hypothetical protein
VCGVCGLEFDRGEEVRLAAVPDSWDIEADLGDFYDPDDY